MYAAALYVENDERREGETDSFSVPGGSYQSLSLSLCARGQRGKGPEPSMKPFLSKTLYGKWEGVSLWRPAR